MLKKSSTFAASKVNERDIIMETMTIQYNPTNSLVQPIIELIQQVKGIKIISRTDTFVPNAATIAAMKEAREGDLKTYSDVDEMMNDILA